VHVRKYSVLLPCNLGNLGLIEARSTLLSGRELDWPLR